MITADTNTASPFRDNVYIAWDASSGGSPGGGVRVATPADHGVTLIPSALTTSTAPAVELGLLLCRPGRHGLCCVE